MAGPVKLINPDAEPYPIEKFKLLVTVSKLIPGAISFPEPMLLVTGGVSFKGLNPTALSAPGGDRSKVNSAAVAAAAAVNIAKLKKLANGSELVFMVISVGREAG